MELIGVQRWQSQYSPSANGLTACIAALQRVGVSRKFEVRQYGHEVIFAAFSFGDTVRSTLAGSSRFASAFRPYVRFPLLPRGKCTYALYCRCPKAVNALRAISPHSMYARCRFPYGNRILGNLLTLRVLLRHNGRHQRRRSDRTDKFTSVHFYLPKGSLEKPPFFTKDYSTKSILA